MDIQFELFSSLSLLVNLLLASLLILLYRKLNQWRHNNQAQSHRVDAFLEIQQNQSSQLGSLSTTIDQKLSTGLGETKSLYVSVIKRLALIEQTQQTLQQISHHILDLEKVLKHPQRRGAYGEVQLQQLVENCIPEKHRQYQKTLSNGRRADCVILLACNPGQLIIDAKFPLANFNGEKKENNRLFKQDIKGHVDDIADKYIIPGETLDHAIMFIPAEGVFHHICDNYPELVDYAQRKRIWLASPTTLLSHLHISMSTIRDQQLQEHIGLMKKQLQVLDEEFDRFDKRIDQTSRHISMCHKDVSDLHCTAKKISRSFKVIREFDETLVT